MADQPTDKVTPDTVVHVSANLEAYVAERAGRMAEAALARAKTEADQRVNAICAELGAKLERQTDLVAELQRQLAACVKQLDRHPELADALGVPKHTPWPLLVAKVREQATERDEALAERDELESLADAQATAAREAEEDRRDEVKQLRAELRAARDELARVRRELDLVGPVTVQEGTPPAAQQCPHRDFDDPTPCSTCP